MNLKWAKENTMLGEFQITNYFGGICRENKEIFVKIVENKSRNILGREILANLNSGTTIFTNQWPSYISFFGDKKIYNHNFVNHSLNFIDALDGTQTQMIEYLWSEFNGFERKWGYIKQRLIYLYISKFKLRRNFKQHNRYRKHYP